MQNTVAIYRAFCVVPHKIRFVIVSLMGAMILLFSGAANAAMFINSQTATGITETGVTLTGNVTSTSGISYGTQFDYGLTGAYGTTVAGSPNVTLGTRTISSSGITGLTCGTVYHFRLTVVGALSGPDATFTTSDCPVVAVTVPAPIPDFNNLATRPGVVGFGSQPNVVDLSSSKGPDALNCLMATLRQVLGNDATYQGQGSNGSVRVAQGGSVISFYPLSASTNASLPQGINLMTGNGLSIGTSCGNVNIAPSLYNLSDFGALLNGIGLTAQISSQGVITLNINGTTYVALADYRVNTGTAGAARFIVGADGLLRFVDSAGFSQVLRPAFLDTDALSAQAGVAFGGITVIQSDGTAQFTNWSGQQFVLTPDWFFSPVSGANTSKTWWQDGANHYMFRPNIFSATAQGFTIRAR
jgi:hypothetical protein